MKPVTLTMTQSAEILHWMDRLEEKTEAILAAIPFLDDDELSQVNERAESLGMAAWRIRAKGQAEILQRLAKRQSGGRGRGDDEQTGIVATINRVATELGIGARQLRKNAEVHQTFFSETVANVCNSLRDGTLDCLKEQGFFEAALATDDPHATIEYFARCKTENPNFSVRDAWRYVREKKAPPIEQPIPPLIEDPAVKRAWEAYGQACAELARTTKAAGVPLGRILLGCTNELREEVQRPGTTRRQQLLDLIAGAVDEIELIALHLSVDRIWVATWLNRLESEGAVESFEKPRAPGARGQARTGYRLRSK